MIADEEVKPILMMEQIELTTRVQSLQNKSYRKAYD